MGFTDDTIVRPASFRFSTGTPYILCRVQLTSTVSRIIAAAVTYFEPTKNWFVWEIKCTSLNFLTTAAIRSDKKPNVGFE